MVTLSANWLTEGHIDFEYKKYLLLAYLQQLEANFQEVKLYPDLQDLVHHFHNLLGYKRQVEAIKQEFPKEITAVDFENFALKFRAVIEDSSIMNELTEIVEFSLPVLEQKLKEGKEIYHWIENQLRIYPVGLQSINVESGVVILGMKQASEACVYQYKVTLFESAQDMYRGVSFSLLEQVQKSPFMTYETMKLGLMRKHSVINFSTTFLIQCETQVPLQESLLPVVKRHFMQFLATQS